MKNDVCPTCLSPCQVNVGAMKQFVPYAKFLLRAYRVKRDPARHLETLPTGAMGTAGAVCAPCAADRVVARVLPAGSCASSLRRPHGIHPLAKRSVGGPERSRRRRTVLDCAGRPARLPRSRADGLSLDRAALHRRARGSAAARPASRDLLVSTFLGTFLPASVGGDAVRAYSAFARQRLGSRGGGVGLHGPDARRRLAAAAWRGGSRSRPTSGRNAAVVVGAGRHGGALRA